jgi:hypothetical protein
MSGFDPKSLLGKAESDRLEFKEAEALRRPANIAREVVGFLNAKGGEIWIGVKEEHEKAVDFQRIADVEQARSALLNHLIDTIEPPFRSDEVDLKCKGDLIHVTVKKGIRPPYAQRDGGRRFWIRIDHRLREMSREEIGKEFAEAFKAHSTEKDRVAEITEKLRKDQASAALEEPELWLQLVPTESLDIDFNDKPTQDQFRVWLTDPSATGNRRSGWDFVHDLRGPRFLGDQVRHGNDDDYMRTQITEQGQLTFRVHSDSLRQLVGAVSSFAPYALVEYPVSVFRLMAAILGRHAEAHADMQVVTGLVISGIRGWSLSPGSPREPARHWGGPKAFEDDVLEIDPAQLVFAANDLKENPDRCGLRVVRLIYGRFGFESGAIPPEFNQQQGRLHL